MEKPKNTALIIAGGVLLALLVCAGIFALTGGFWDIFSPRGLTPAPTAPPAFPGAQSLSASGVKSIDVDWISGSAAVEIIDGDDIFISESADRPISDGDALVWSVDDGRLKIEYCRLNSLNVPEKSLRLGIPASLAENMDEFDFESASASLEIYGVSARDFSFDSVSGKLNAKDIFARELELDSTSGDLSIGGVFDELDADTVSGRLLLSGECDELSFSSTSGALTAELKLCPNKLNANTISGDVTLTLPGDSSFTLKFDSISGDLDSELAVKRLDGRYVCGDGRADFDVDTTSGALKLREA